ncbi:MAG: hypothetical protein PHE59_00005, partial [Patescibacteria group bacterium]|nr:hypothetical protein [Patescibacteria group bacterium]
EKGRDITLEREVLGTTFNVVRNFDNIYEALKEANLGNTWQAEIVRRYVNGLIQPWIDKYGVDGAEKIFQKDILKEYNLIEQ